MLLIKVKHVNNFHKRYHALLKFTFFPSSTYNLQDTIKLYVIFVINFTDGIKHYHENRVHPQCALVQSD